MNEMLMALSLILAAPTAPTSLETRTVQTSRIVSTPRPVAATSATTPQVQERKVKRHAILFFTASWCPACLQMKANTLPRVSLPGHELRIIDVDANPGLCESYGIQSLPSYIVLDSVGRAYRQGVGFRDVQDFVNFLNGR